MKKENRSGWVLSAIFCLGLGLLLYPSIANWWNGKVSTRAITGYQDAVSSLCQEDCDREFEKANAYNEALRQISAPLVNYEKVAGYEQILNLAGNGVIGYIDIGKIDVRLPIYHGVSPSVLSSAAGHLPGTSLPVGGIGTHSVISAHRGLPSALLFTYLDRLVLGDTFSITVLNEQLSYEVDQIRIVTPQEVENLKIDPKMDYVTLLTCTPYGINTDRLLVRGHRTENANPALLVLSNEAIELDNLILAPVLAVPALIVIFAAIFAADRNDRRKKRQKASGFLSPKP